MALSYPPGPGTWWKYPRKAGRPHNTQAQNHWQGKYPKFCEFFYFHNSCLTIGQRCCELIREWKNELDKCYPDTGETVVLAKRPASGKQSAVKKPKTQSFSPAEVRAKYEEGELGKVSVYSLGEIFLDADRWWSAYGSSTEGLFAICWRAVGRKKSRTAG